MASRADARDAATLRSAAWVLESRSKKLTMPMRVVVHLLRHAADKISPPGGEA